ncbi:MAG TPA: FHA domain-containing protein, partial [Polyangiaceae bacterium]|nr:FHA domain-containing protein [Polyangiaceae bacterium]
PQAQPPSPYGGATTATLQGQAGIFTVMAGQEMRAGRDAAQCGIVLSEGRVSSVHATLKLEGGQLWVRDENSNNGTLVNGNRLSPGVWSPVPQGSIVRFGPVEFSARIG